MIVLSEYEKRPFIFIKVDFFEYNGINQLVILFLSGRYARVEIQLF
jgi:hypothetical protein